MKAIIIGAGPAGLTAAWEFNKHGIKTKILESDKETGGISRTVDRNGWKFDIGGHRFFTKVDEVYEIWDEMLDKEDFIMRPRMSRIYYKGKFYDYPLKIFNALFNLGLLEAIRCVFSYVYIKIFPIKNIDNFETWVASRFGWRLYNIFFKTYTEKVWGIPANTIGADWASQRIKNLSLGKAIFNALMPKRNSEIITTLIDEFKYPKLGPGMMWDSASSRLEDNGHEIIFNSRIEKIKKLENSGYEVVTHDGRSYSCEALFSSMPLAHLPSTLEPKPAREIIKAGEDLKFRDFLTVALVVDKKFAFPDNWVYIHEPHVRVGRVQNYGSWSPYLVKEGKTCLGLEYFVTKNDDLWDSSDEELINLAINELEELKLIEKNTAQEGYVVRMPKAYPVYDLKYKDNIEIIKAWLLEEHPNLYPMGRNGMHRYNNQDHSMMTAVKSVRNCVLKEKNNIWGINVDDGYHEEGVVERSVPTQNQ